VDHGQGLAIYYYRHFDQLESTMAEANVFELDPKSFAMVRQIQASAPSGVLPSRRGL